MVLGIRAEHLWGSGDILDRHSECALDGRLEFSELRGAETYHYVRIAGREVVVRVSPELPPQSGRKSGWVLRWPRPIFSIRKVG